MTTDGIYDVVDVAIKSIEDHQIEIGNAVYRHAYITGVLTGLLKQSLTGDKAGVIRYLEKQINLKQNGRTENR